MSATRPVLDPDAAVPDTPTYDAAPFARLATGDPVPGLVLAARLVDFPGHHVVVTIRAVIGRETWPGVDLVWEERALYAHVGIDLLGADGGVFRVADVSVRDVTARFLPESVMPSFADERPSRFRN